MKYSIYNTFIKVSPKIILLFNSFTDCFMFLNASVSELLKDASLIKEKHLKLYRDMVKRGFYVPDNVDEFQKLKKYSDEILRDTRTFFLIVNPTMNCNLKCWYCYEKHEVSEMNEATFQNVLSFIKNKIESGIESFTLGFFGGEPLMKYKSVVKPLVDYTYNLCKQKDVRFGITFTTNGTLLTKNMIEELCLYSTPSFQITLDGNEELHNKVRYLANQKGTYSLIMQNIKMLLEHNCSVRLRINYTKDNVKTLHEIIQDASRLYCEHKKIIEFDFHRVWQDRDKERVLPEIKVYADELVKEGFIVFYDDYNGIKEACYADRMNTAVINYNGDVFKCTAKDFTKENREGVLLTGGTIEWENSQEYRISLKLKNPKCHHCSIAPICGGGCSRYILEKEGKPYCLFNHDTKAIETFVMNHVEKLIRNGCVHQ